MKPTLIYATTSALALVLSLTVPAMAQSGVSLYDGDQPATIIHENTPTSQLAGELLARDLKSLTGKAAVVSTDLKRCHKVCVVFGHYDSALVKAIAKDAGLDLSALKGEWERYERVLVQSRSNPEVSYLLIAGSDRRGTVWGVIDLTREMGVSAWEWWADVAPKKVDHIHVSAEPHKSETPSVPYRGIFLNDEDWAMYPWAAETYEPEVGNFGPKTYSRVFELMWRLKANTLWPAMHHTSIPFYQTKGNAEAADRYGVIMATSHAEPMARNNTREWDDDKRGEFNYFVNSKSIIKYWTERAGEVREYENVYTLGLRGKRDSGMFGAQSPEHARDAMTEILQVQREILSKAQRKPADQIPQVLTLYKEVQDIYKAGLKVPDDVTLVWPEDNYGYINQLPTAQERARKGGSGIYYHVSYLGRPHDYLWLGTTHPALLREQMDRAWQMDARRIWILNVGDIKPAEYLTHYFLDLAFDYKQFSLSSRAHLQNWAAKQFGAEHAAEITDIMFEYYDLAFARRPEFMGGGQTEPTRHNVVSDYVRSGGAEALERLGRYEALSARAEALEARLPEGLKDAYFQLVLYPVRGSASLNERVLKLDAAGVYAKAGRVKANRLVDEARSAHQRIVDDTARYNAMQNGKWRHYMNMAPRGLPVFDEPLWPQWRLPASANCNVDASALSFTKGTPAQRTVTIFGSGPLKWVLRGLPENAVSQTSGELTAENEYEQQVTISYDGKTEINGGAFNCTGNLIGLFFRYTPPAGEFPPEVNRVISIKATSAQSADWEVIPELGSRGDALRSRLELGSVDNVAGLTPLSYRFKTGDRSDAKIRLVGLPVHALTGETRLRLGVRLNGGDLQVLDFETVGRSDEWKQNVLSNTAVRTINIKQLEAGVHTLEVYPLDPGFLLDRIDVLLDGAPAYYGAPLLK
ncbi:MAG: glycosyl hydrolase 115 family protein [Asticcacaulis sp.]